MCHGVTPHGMLVCDSMHVDAEHRGSERERERERERKRGWGRERERERKRELHTSAVLEHIEGPLNGQKPVWLLLFPQAC